MAQRGQGTAGARAGAGGARASSDRRAGRGSGRGYDEERPADRVGLSGAQLTALRGRLRGVVEPVVTGSGLDLEDFAVSRAGRRFVVRVTVDGEAGVGHDELTDVSREISAALDEAEESGGEFATDSYTLEVSSPGVDRPLTLPRHWRRNVGRLVKVTVGARSHTARVLAVTDTGVQLEGVAEPVAFADLGPGRVQVEFNRLAELTDEEIGDEFADVEDDIEDGAETKEEDEA